MEIHHKHHHDPPGKKESPLKHYFFEFLMLFLAVSAGFFVENQREHYIEHRRAKEFAGSLFSDLRSDTSSLQQYLNYYTYASSMIDTLFLLLRESEPTDIPSGKLYWYGLYGGAARSFVPNDATIEQMKGSGSLRYFTDHTVAKEVAEYDQLCRQLVKDQDLDQGLHDEVRKLRSRIFDFRYNELANSIYQESLRMPNRQRVDSFLQSNPHLLTTEGRVFNEYVEMIRSRVIFRKMQYADSTLVKANQLMESLKRVYHLD